jgi:threonylcarbamoyladenosine tRNA methylthiotransferase MtaB
MTSFSVQNFGCRVNQAETFSWVNGLQSSGLVYEPNVGQSDIVVVNTCTLTSRADRDVRSFLNRMTRDNPQARLILTGCYAERHAGHLRKNPQIWQVISNGEKENLTDRVVSRLGPQKGGPFRHYRSRALVKVQDGCDFRCSFCIIPQVRGRSVSLPPDKVVQKVREYTKQGYREIVLTGIHLCSYGRDLKPEKRFVDLLRDVERVESLGQIRLSSLDPRFLDGDLRDHIASSPKICPHFHLSLQHGFDKVLRRMGRAIKVEDYRQVLYALRERRPQASLGADLIAGFPEETEMEFEEMFRFLEDSPLTYFHVFPYSPRPGTPAARWEPVGEKVKRERAARLRKLSRQKNFDFRQSLSGKVVEGIVVKHEDTWTQVVTSNYIQAHVTRCKSEVRTNVKVRITDVLSNATRGEIVP